MKNAAIRFLIFLLFTSLACEVRAQMVSGNIFLKGNYVEVGQSEIGAFGSTINALGSYHPRVGAGGVADNRLGFVSDPDQDGWTVGVPNYIGDYFLPGDPHEGFDIQIGSRRNTAWNTGPGGSFNALTGTLMLTGSSESYHVDGTKRIAVWKGFMGTLSIVQKTTLDINSTYFLVEVTLKNVGSTPLNDIYYNRTVDPDNEAALTSDFSTQNLIQYQPATSSTDPDYRCLVTARGLAYPSKSYLGLGTYDCRAKAYIINSGLAPMTSLPSIYSGSSAYFTEEGATYTNDVGIGIVYNIGSLPAGDSTSIAYAYILKESDLDSAMARIRPHWNIEGEAYGDRDTIEVCAGTSFDIEIMNRGNYTWGAWTPSAGLSELSGPVNTITVGSATRTYRIVGLSPNCMNDTLRITVKPVTPKVNKSIMDSICHGAVYNFNGTILSSSGIYYDTLARSFPSCDSIVRLDLYVNPAANDTIYAENCPADSILFYGTYYHEEGIYIHEDMVMGCEVNHVLYYSHVDTLFNTDHLISCEGEAVVYAGISYTSDTVISTAYISTGGCDSIVSVEIEFMPLYMQSVHLTICENDLPYTYGSIVIPAGTSSTLNLDTLELSTIYGCDSFININVSIIDSHLLVRDTTLCFGTSMAYQGGVITEPGTYMEYYSNAGGCDSNTRWQVSYSPAPAPVDSTYNGCNSLVYRDTEYSLSTVLYDTLYNALGCDSIHKRVYINVYHDSYDTLNVDICEGESFTFEGRTYDSDTETTVVLENNNGCDSFVTLRVKVHPLPDIALTFDAENDIVCIHDTIRLQGTGGTFYKYFNQYGDFLGDSSVWILMPGTEHIYKVSGTDDWGCTSESSLSIYAEACCEVSIPNAFSPNGDGLNDSWGPVTYGNPGEYHLEIFDRYGSRVYSSYNVHDKWKGQYLSGQDAAAGTYYYVVSGTCFDGTSWIHKGDITLIR